MRTWDTFFGQGSNQSQCFEVYEHPSRSNGQGGSAKARASHLLLEIAPSWLHPLRAPSQNWFCINGFPSKVQESSQIVLELHPTWHLSNYQPTMPIRKIKAFGILQLIQSQRFVDDILFVVDTFIMFFNKICGILRHNVWWPPIWSLNFCQIHVTASNSNILNSYQQWIFSFKLDVIESHESTI